MKGWPAFVFAIIMALIYVKGQAPPVPPTPEEIDAELYLTYKNEVCSRVPAFSGSADAGPDFTDEMSEGEVLELSFVNMAYGLNSDSVSHLKPELGWKKSVIDMISLITKTTCKEDIISESYLNAAKNLFLYYLSKRPKSLTANATDPAVREKQWGEILNSLSTCSNGITPIDISTQCGVATTYEGKDGGGKPIVEITERLDEEIGEKGDAAGLDIIIDTVWWMFSTTYSRCYAYFYPNEDIILLFFQLFREDFLEQFIGRWRNAGQNAVHFPIIFGPYDFKTPSENVRKCATAAFQYEGLSERQLVRPVTVLVDNNAMRNYKAQQRG